MGKRALVGLHGIEKVTRGFRGGQEINTVWYDPRAISVKDMVEALKKARTFRGVAEE